MTIQRPDELIKILRPEFMTRAEVFANNVPLTDYSATSTIVGWSSFTTKSIYYEKSGRKVFVQFNIDGTSNSTTTTFTLPFDQSSSVILETAFRAYDNGGATQNFGILALSTSSDLVTLYLGIGGAWTASGRKICRGQFWYWAA